MSDGCEACDKVLGAPTCGKNFCLRAGRGIPFEKVSVGANAGIESLGEWGPGQGADVIFLRADGPFIACRVGVRPVSEKPGLGPRSGKNGSTRVFGSIPQESRIWQWRGDVRESVGCGTIVKQFPMGMGGNIDISASCLQEIVGAFGIG